MDRDQAEKALGIIRGVIENTREDLVEHNWGLIWMCHAFTNGLGFAAIGYFIERNDKPIFWYLVPLAVVALVNITIVALLSERNRGTRSFVELQIHGIWTTYIVVNLGVVAMLHLASAPPTLFCSLMGLTTAFGFSMMGVVFYRRFFFLAVVFLVLGILCAVPNMQPAQWYLLAIAWALASFVPGLMMTRERRRRANHERAAEVL